MAIARSRARPSCRRVAILSLALGIGANTAIFSVLDTLLLRSLPVDAPRQLVLLGNEAGRRPHWTNPIWEQIRGSRRAVRWRLRGVEHPLQSGGARRERVRRRPVGQREDVRRARRAGDARPDVHGRRTIGRAAGPDGPVAVISYGFWQRRFGGAADAIGRSLTVERVPYTIVGVTPPQFFGVDVGRTFDVAVPIGTVTLIRGPRALERRSSWWLRIMIRLKPGQSAEAATARCARCSRRFARRRCRTIGSPAAAGAAT